MAVAEFVGKCQVCGGYYAVKVNPYTGLYAIAKHGFKRMGGWQTADCYGANHQPLEVSCDIIEGAIQHAKDYILETQIKILEMNANPPDTLTNYSRRPYKTYDRPEGFDSNMDKIPQNLLDYFYTNLFREMRYKYLCGIADAKNAIPQLQERLDKWEQKPLLPRKVKA